MGGSTKPQMAPRTPPPVAGRLLHASPVRAKAHAEPMGRVFLPTPVTLSPHRRHALPIEPSAAARLLSATLQALAAPEPRTPEHTAKTDLQPFSLGTPPSTPPLGPRKRARSPQKSASVQIVDLDYVRSIPRVQLPNPFLEPAQAPRLAPAAHDTLEVVHNRTAQRVAVPIPEEHLRFQPRKLDFTLAVRSSANDAVGAGIATQPGNQTHPEPKTHPRDKLLAERFLEKSIGPKFTLGTSSFHIYSDN